LKVVVSQQLLAGDRVVSLFTRWFRFPEAYWAVATTLIIARSMEDANATISLQRLAGTGLGAAVAALMAELGVNSTVRRGACVCSHRMKARYNAAE
jgi:uncharacterized membrane protein YgaE (UPF0421/DUF939 family)